MAEWRIKQYYEPRVLISVADVFESPFPDSLMCLTGAEMNMLRNLTQYLHRRATWVSVYREHDYLAPTDEEWDLLDAAVAALEDKLMGCTELTEMLDAIKAATECVCEMAEIMASGAWPAGGQITGQPDYDDYQSDVEEDEGDPPDPWASWDAWRIQKCKSAQKLIDDVLDRLGDMNVAVGAGTVLNFAAVMALLIASALVPPIVIVLAIAALLAQIGIAALTTEGTLWLEDNKFDIVCIIFNAPTTLSARTGVYAYIDENWDVEGSSAVIKYLLNWWALSSIFDGNMPGYADWEGDYSEAYCADCEWGGIPGVYHWDWPPCPAAWVPSGGAACYNDATWGYVPRTSGADQSWTGPWVPVAEGAYTMAIWTEFKSNRPNNWDCGTFQMRRAYLPDKSDEVLLYQDTLKSHGVNVVFEFQMKEQGLTMSSDGWCQVKFNSWSQTYYDYMHQVELRLDL